MEDKSFAWLLRLLSINGCSFRMLDTFGIDKDSIIAGFSTDPSMRITKIPPSSMSFSTTYDCIKFAYHQKAQKNPKILHFFSLHKGKRKEFSSKYLRSLFLRKRSLPVVSYYQFASVPLQKIITWSVEKHKSSLKSSITPNISSVPVIEQGKELLKSIISLIEIHECKKIVKLQLEFFLDKVHHLWLSGMPLCTLSSSEKYLHPTITSPKVNEVHDMINELSTPSKILKRKPSCIKIIDAKESFADRVKIETPDIDRRTEESIDSDSNEDAMLEKLRNNEGKLRKEKELRKSNKNFIELLCRTKIIQNDPSKRLIISDTEMKTERKKFFSIANLPQKPMNDQKIHARNSSITINYKKHNSIVLKKLSLAEKRSLSTIGLILPVLTARSQKTLT